MKTLYLDTCHWFFHKLSSAADVADAVSSELSSSNNARGYSGTQCIAVSHGFSVELASFGVSFNRAHMLGSLLEQLVLKQHDHYFLTQPNIVVHKI